jgi:spore maturation protein CgeB
VRWLLVHPGPDWSVADVHNGWAEALRGLGEQVAEYELDKRLAFYDLALLETGKADSEGHPEVRKAVTRDEAIGMAGEGLLAACYRVWPDVVLCTSAFFVPPFVLEVVRARGHRIVLLFTEGPYQTATQLKMAAYADLSLVNDPVDISSYRDAGPAEYMPHAYRESVHHPGPATAAMACDLAFVGTAFPSRVTFLEAMDTAGLDVLLAGAWSWLDEKSPLRKLVAHDLADCVDNAQTADIYRSARTGINLYRREADGGDTAEGVACSPREIEQAACGLWFARDPRPESDELFPMLPAFTGPAEACDLIRWALDHPAQRAAAAAQARAAIAGRTFGSNARQLLRLLDRQPVTR